MKARPGSPVKIAEAIIHNLDEDGMLRASLEEIADMGPYPPEEVQKALAVVQGFGPDSYLLALRGLAARLGHGSQA